MSDEQLELPFDPPLREEPAPAPPDYLTAFVVMVHHDGTVEASSRLDNEFSVQREANLADMRQGAHTVVDDINAVFVAQRVQASIQHAAQAALENQHAAAIRAKLDERGITLPRLR